MRTRVVIAGRAFRISSEDELTSIADARVEVRSPFIKFTLKGRLGPCKYDVVDAAY